MTPLTLNQEWLNSIRNSGYRLTQPRRAVVDILSQTDQALPAITIFDIARMNYPSIGLVSIYRTLEMLESLDLIQRVHQPDGCHAYIAAFTGHQHLLLCQDCGATFVFQGDNLDSLFSRVEQESGYQVSDHWLQLFGTCTKCQASN